MEHGERRGAKLLSREEREEAEARFEAELAEEHADRQDAVQRRRRKRGDHRSTSDEEARLIALYDLREEVRQRFYKENGYRRYIDSTGREVWLSPEEYAQRVRRRKRRSRSDGLIDRLSGNSRQLLLYAALGLVALVLGFALAR